MNHHVLKFAEVIHIPILSRHVITPSMAMHQVNLYGDKKLFLTLFFDLDADCAGTISVSHVLQHRGCSLRVSGSSSAIDCSNPASSSINSYLCFNLCFSSLCEAFLT